MKKIRVSEATEIQLDWMVAKALGLAYRNDEKYGPMCFRPSTTKGVIHWGSCPLPYSTDWAQGGRIIEMDRICIDIGHDGVWLAYCKQNYDDEKEFMQSGSSPLIAAMRSYVAMRLGDFVDVPEELV